MIQVFVRSIQVQKNLDDLAVYIGGVIGRGNNRTKNDLAEAMERLHRNGLALPNRYENVNSLPLKKVT